MIIHIQGQVFSEPCPSTQMPLASDPVHARVGDGGHRWWGGAGRQSPLLPCGQLIAVFCHPTSHVPKETWLALSSQNGAAISFQAPHVWEGKDHFLHQMGN